MAEISLALNDGGIAQLSLEEPSGCQSNGKKAQDVPRAEGVSHLIVIFGRRTSFH